MVETYLVHFALFEVGVKGVSSKVRQKIGGSGEMARTRTEKRKESNGNQRNNGDKVLETK